MNIAPYRPYDPGDPLPYLVRPLAPADARAFIAKNHYLGGMTPAPTACYGLTDGRSLAGVIVFATPCAEAVRRMVFGPDHAGRVTELSRLVITDDAAPVNTDPAHAANTESWFIARALNALKESRPDLWAVVSFADPSAGHVGTVYQASNGLYYGLSKAERSYRDQDGRSRSRRQCKVNVSPDEARARGWEVLPATRKHRYCFSLPDDRRHARALKGLLRLPEDVPYPKRAVTMNRQLTLF